MTSRRWALPTAVAAGILLLGAGGVVLWRAAHRTFGWFAYAPLSEPVFAPSSGFADERLGIALLVVGSLVLGAVGGFVIGRRARR